MSIQSVDELLDQVSKIKETFQTQIEEIETNLQQSKNADDSKDTLETVRMQIDLLLANVDGLRENFKAFCERDNEPNRNCTETEEKPFIKVVDIKKILGGNNFEASFEDTPIVLSSSDDECPNAEPTGPVSPKKNGSIKINPLAVDKNKSNSPQVKNSTPSKAYEIELPTLTEKKASTKKEDTRTGKNETKKPENSFVSTDDSEIESEPKSRAKSTINCTDKEIVDGKELCIPLLRIDLDQLRRADERSSKMDANKRGRTSTDGESTSTKKRIRFADENNDTNTDKVDASETETEGCVEAKEANGGEENKTKKVTFISSDSESSEKETEVPKKSKHKVKKKSVISDSDSDGEFKADAKEAEEESSSDSETEKEAVDEKKSKSKSRRRIKRTKSSSSEDDEEKSTRKQIRKVIGRKELSESTIQAEKEEKERKARLMEKQKKYNQILTEQTNASVDKLILDYDEKTKKELLKVADEIVSHMKPHQASGVQFMWDACFESLKRVKENKGSGCILAHCMGLGKTLQVIALTHTLIMNREETGVQRALIVCPLNTVLNWKSEYEKWMPHEDDVDIYELVSCKSNIDRQYTVESWYKNGGVLIIGYNMFRTLSNPDNKKITKKIRKTFQEGFLDPGPDIVVCDEGHLLKNEKTHLSVAMNRIKTLRRIVLTGTPLQNNLREYFCMVQFIKPNLLGTYKEYLNRFVNPITNGQYTDSTPRDTELMRKRSHVLHKLLDGVVQRRDYSVLQPYLPPKYEYVLFVNLAEKQVQLYENYMYHFARRNNDGDNKTSFIFSDFQSFQRICTHPRVLKDKSIEERNKAQFNNDSESEGSIKDFIDDDGSSTPGSSSSDDEVRERVSKRKRPLTRAQLAQRKENDESGSDLEVSTEPEKKEWWQEFCDGEELENINHSGKLFLLFEILRECEQIGDKVLVFSQSLYTLNCIEYFLRRIDEATQEGKPELVGGHTGSWAIGLDYFRLDGSSSCDNRAIWCDSFNNSENVRARLFLISTKAGGLGINLVAANRVIIFDVSWNPSHDVQSIYRVYRFGQKKPSYIYRFVAYGTMEMKVYERQVTKQAISKRVIDEQQIDRHYNQHDLAELYKCDLKPADRPIPLVPKDVLLGEMLQKHEKFIYKYHEHQSLLENKEEDCLTEEERKAAWDEFENEKVNRVTTNYGGTSFSNSSNLFNTPMINGALMHIVRRDNPTWSEVQIKGIIPALLQQLKLQLSEGDYSLFTRVQFELRLMEREQQKMIQQHYIRQLIDQQEMQSRSAGNLYINPNSLLEQQLVSGPSQVQMQNKRTNSNEIIDLND